MTDLVRKHKIQVLDHGARRSKEAGFVVHAIVSDPDIQRLQDAGYNVEKLEDVDEVGQLAKKK